ncbi:MAG TPA: glycosyltransferase family 4 protein [Casimicrobiaceae bacterium]|nr:glycosyltransferase family 4 protein [Casimicrobiaceae bacterium]
MGSAVSSHGVPAVAAAATRGVIHLVNPLWDAHGGADWRAVEMYEALRAERSVRLWSRFHPARAFVERYPVELIRPWLGRWPVGGTFIFIGAYFRVGHWFKAAFPQRTILIYNTHQPDRLAKVLARLEAWHRNPVEIVYTSPLLRRLSDRPGPVIESPIDIARFAPAAARERATRPFTVGRLSRDIATKHHRDDPEVYRALAGAGVSLRVMGGSSIHERMDAEVDVLPAGARRAVDFLHDLDCFYYRTSDQWLEAFGRVVFEAMACGLPVVCGRRGGYADYIAHGVNGFLFDTNEQAVALILRLRDDAALRDRIGRAARRTVEELYRGRAWRRKLAYFLTAGSENHPARVLADSFDATPSELH